jgi:hypothetical protein
MEVICSSETPELFASFGLICLFFDPEDVGYMYLRNVEAAGWSFGLLFKLEDR